MAGKIGYGKRRLIQEIVKGNWNVENPESIKFNINDILFIMQELDDQEGIKYFDEDKTSNRGYAVFRNFAKHLLYRNLANYDSMVLLTAEKGCLTDDTKIMMPRDLLQYPDGIPIKELIGKGPQKVYSFNSKTKQLELKQSDGVEFAKHADVFEIELTTGQTIKATDDHPFMLMDGSYKKLKDLVWLDVIKNKPSACFSRYREGSVWKYTDRLRMVSTRPDKNDYMKVDYGPVKDGKNYNNKKIEHRFILEQIGKDISNKIVHHADNNHFNNTISNLKLITQTEHVDIHMQDYLFKSNNSECKHTGYSTKRKQHISSGSEEFKQMVSEQRKEYFSNPENIAKYKELMKKNGSNTNMYNHGGIIKNITYLGKQNVYDVVNVRDNKNFIANGFVVSNTGKSSAAIMLARAWCQLIGIRFDPKRHLAYNNKDVMDKIDMLKKFEPLVCDEAVRFASAADWNKGDSKELRKKLAEVRTKHMLFILCFPLKIYKMEKNYLESFVNYWIDLFGRGVGAIYVKDRNPVDDSWRMKAFKNVGSYTEFTNVTDVEKKLKKHPNFWQVIKFPRPPDWLYKKYLAVREKNVYDNETVREMVSTGDIHKALLVLALQDIMMNDATLNMNRITLHIKNTYDIPISKKNVQEIIHDSKQLVTTIREEKIA
jgi:hypothetical protein